MPIGDNTATSWFDALILLNTEFQSCGPIEALIPELKAAAKNYQSNHSSITLDWIGSTDGLILVEYSGY
jgi:hypothetical protein